MKEICEDIKSHISDVLLEWERLVREQPWFSLPAEHRIDSLPDVLIGLADAALCSPGDVQAHRRKVDAAVEHGHRRRQQGIPEHLIVTVYHLLRQAIWYYLVRKLGTDSRVQDAVMRIDSAITTATNASMWGYHRTEIEAMGKWEEGMTRIVQSSALLRRYGNSESS